MEPNLDPHQINVLPNEPTKYLIRWEFEDSHHWLRRHPDDDHREMFLICHIPLVTRLIFKHGNKFR